ncbi:MAG: hypothetical protein ABW298_02335 [Candidatus Binatia bacterium]
MWLARGSFLDGLRWQCADFLQALFELANVVEQLAVLLPASGEPPLQRREEGAKAFRLAREVADSFVGPGGLLPQRAHGFVQNLELTIASLKRCRRRLQGL